MEFCQSEKVGTLLSNKWESKSNTKDQMAKIVE